MSIASIVTLGFIDNLIPTLGFSLEQTILATYDAGNLNINREASQSLEIRRTLTKNLNINRTVEQ